MSAPCRHYIWRELAVRETDGLAVSLFWSNASDRVKVEVVDSRLDERFVFHVPVRALAAFHHPFAYATEPGASFGDTGSRRGPRLAPERSTVR